MSMARFRLRSLMAFVALAAIGAWVVVMVGRYWTAVSMVQSESNPSLLPYYAVTVLAVIVSISLVSIGVFVFAVRFRALLRATSHRPSRIRSHP
jgi:hypothetical protein